MFDEAVADADADDSDGDGEGRSVEQDGCEVDGEREGHPCVTARVDEPALRQGGEGEEEKVVEDCHPRVDWPDEHEDPGEDDPQEAHVEGNAQRLTPNSRPRPRTCERARQRQVPRRWTERDGGGSGACVGLEEASGGAVAHGSLGPSFARAIGPIICDLPVRDETGRWWAVHSRAEAPARSAVPSPLRRAAVGETERARHSDPCRRGR